MLPITTRLPTRRNRVPRDCRQHRPELPDSRTRPSSSSAAVRQDDSPVICAVCETFITSQDQAIAVSGSHEHAFFNPAGIAFSLACFRTAPGCILEGKATTTFSWFSGYSWQIALCASCRSHLGWFFRANDDSFFALIRANIR